LDKQYPLNRRNEITELDISNKGLEGSLKLERFSNLEVLKCSQNDLFSLDISDCVDLEVLDCRQNSLTDLDISECPNLEEIGCSHNQLNSLNVSNATKLKVISCGYNQLTNLNLSNCSQLKIIYCTNNNLVKLDLTNCPNINELWCWGNFLINLNFLNDLSSEKLEGISIEGNNFPLSDLTPFSRFVNLKKLYLGNLDEKKINQNIYNRFYGSLEPLKSLTKLEFLSIRSTDIDSGLEYLPNNIEEFHCYTVNSQFDVAKIYEELQPFAIDIRKGKYNWEE